MYIYMLYMCVCTYKTTIILTDNIVRAQSTRPYAFTTASSVIAVVRINITNISNEKNYIYIYMYLFVFESVNTQVFRYYYYYF